MQNWVRRLIRGTLQYWASLDVIWTKNKAELLSIEWNIIYECAAFDRMKKKNKTTLNSDAWICINSTELESVPYVLW